MPPKKANAAKGKKKDDEDFDQLLKELAKSTKAKGKEDQKHADKHVTQAERKAAHRELQKQKEEAASKAMEQRAQQRRLQEMIREMMKNGGGFGQSPFLEAPDTQVETFAATAKAPSKVVAGGAAMQGWRRAMEDAHILQPNFRKADAKGADDFHLFAVMDGHGGDAVAKTTKILMPAILHREFEKSGICENALVKAFSDCDAQINKKHGNEAQTCGCTCVLTLVGENKIWCASVGDSRAVLARKRGENDVVALSFDHKPENEEERKRIEATGGHVENNRVNGNLAMSRALGDFSYKMTSGKPETEQQVICLPEIHTAERRPDDEFLVVACDGIFDVLSNDEVVQAVRAEITAIDKTPGARLSTAQLEIVASNITKRCLAPPSPAGNGPARPDGTDNMSLIVVQL